MNDLVKIKVQLPNEELRRVALEGSQVTVAALRSRVAEMVAAPSESVSLGFVDAENDVITITTDAELAEFVADSAKFSRVPRVVVTLKSTPSSSSSSAVNKNEASATTTSPTNQQQQQPQQQQQEQPEDDRREASPLDVIAELLARPEVIAKLQRTAASPVLWDALSASAVAYLEQGPMGGVTAGLGQWPACRAVLEELVDEVPELQTLVSRVLESHLGSFDPVSAFFAYASGGRGGPHGGWPHHAHHHRSGPFGHPFFRGGPPHPTHGMHPPPPPFARWGGGHCGGGNAASSTGTREIHPNVVCDGCSASFEMKRRAFLASNVTRGGNIAGPRYKSTTLEDYDLCETCYESKRFEEAGPFVRVPGVQPASPQQQQAPAAPACQGSPCANNNNNSNNNPWANNNNGPWGRPRGCRGGGGAFGRCGGIRNVIHEVMSQEAANMAAAIAASLRETNEKKQPDSHEEEKTANPAAPEGEKRVVTPAPVVKVVEPAIPAPVAPEVKVQDVPFGGADVESGEDEWEDASGTPPAQQRQQAVQDPVEKWHAQLSRLTDLGFTDFAQYIPVLEEENGDLERVVNRIIRRNA